ENPVPGDAKLLIDGVELGLQVLIGTGVVEAALDVENGASHVFPMGVLNVLAGEVLDAVASASAEPIIGIALRADSKADDREIARQLAISVEVVNGRQQLTPGQVAGGAEDDQDTRRRQQRSRRTTGERVFL